LFREKKKDVLPTPEDFASHPNYWSEEDFAFTKGSLLELHTNQVLTGVKKSYDLLALQLAVPFSYSIPLLEAAANTLTESTRYFCRS